jgi:type I restriction enzyme S subunit
MTGAAYTLQPLTKFARIIRGVTFSRADSSSTPTANALAILRAGNIADRLIIDDDLVWVASSFVSADQLLREGDIVICMSSGSRSVVGKTARLNGAFEGSVGAFCAIIRPHSALSGKLLNHYFKTQSFATWRLQQAAGANIQNIRHSELERHEIALPEDDREQARIVELLDQADALRRQRAEADAKLARLLPALFRHHFGDPLADNATASLRDVLTHLKNGTTAAQNEDGKGHRVTRIETISAGTIDLNRTRFAEIPDDELPDVRLLPGDILFSHINSETHLGKTALVPELDAPLIHGMNLLLLRPDTNKVTPEFLHTLLCTPSARAFWRTRCRRAVNQASINQGDLSALRFHLPSIEAQVTFTRHAAQTNAALAQAAASAAKLEMLFQTLLHRAFTGELTARWRKAHLREGVEELVRHARS